MTKTTARLVLLTLILVFPALALPAIAQVFPEPAPPNTKAEPQKKPIKKKASKPRKARTQDTATVAPPPSPFVGAIPRKMIGTWWFRTKSGLFSSPFAVWVRIEGGEVGGPIGRVDYIMEGVNPPGNHVCSAVLWLEGFDGTNIVAAEKLENKDLFCPGGDKMRAQLGDQGLWVEFFKPPKKQGKKEKITRKSWATRAVRPS